MALGQFDAALIELDRAERRATSETYTFSCWSYLSCSPDKFVKELEAMRKIIRKDGEVRPLFLQKSHSLH